VIALHPFNPLSASCCCLKKIGSPRPDAVNLYIAQVRRVTCVIAPISIHPMTFRRYGIGFPGSCILPLDDLEPGTMSRCAWSDPWMVGSR
jgi:hypothetical protein